jgi:hypothetical protein
MSLRTDSRSLASSVSATPSSIAAHHTVGMYFVLFIVVEIVIAHTSFNLWPGQIYVHSSTFSLLTYICIMMLQSMSTCCLQQCKHIFLLLLRTTRQTLFLNIHHLQAKTNTSPAAIRSWWKLLANFILLFIYFIYLFIYCIFCCAQFACIGSATIKDGQLDNVRNPGISVGKDIHAGWSSYSLICFQEFGVEVICTIFVHF